MAPPASQNFKFLRALPPEEFAAWMKAAAKEPAETRRQTMEELLRVQLWQLGFTEAIEVFDAVTRGIEPVVFPASADHPRRILYRFVQIDGETLKVEGEFPSDGRWPVITLDGEFSPYFKNKIIHTEAELRAVVQEIWETFGGLAK